MLDEAERSIHDAIAVLSQTVKVYYLLYYPQQHPGNEDSVWRWLFGDVDGQCS
jgi:hypothetical protein